MKHAPQLLPAPRPRWLRGLLGAGSLWALSLGSGHAEAQADISPAPPNILLLVDTSGSMDYKTSSNSFPACRYAGATTTTTPALASERSRWIDLVEVLTGSINNYDCQRLDRNSAGFRSEYKLGSSAPYDALYANPYHRPASGGCVAGPGTLDVSNPALFPAGAVAFHAFDNTASTCTFAQANDGILDAFSGDVRFALMTFDTDPRPAKDASGLWSYFVSSAKQGKPQGCLTPQDQEVGVRNSDAPPWEGRAIGFGNPALGSTDFKTRNDMIQKVLLATRPYGATPIAGMLDDARSYLLTDSSSDPLNSAFKFGPQGDPAKDCRHKSIILLSDGQPNMDLRPFCEPGGCPYDKAEDIAQDLKSKGYEIYVIGFALATVTVDGNPMACSKFTALDFDESNASGICAKNPGDAAIQACCALNRIAAAGGHAPQSPTDADWRYAHFADNRDELRKQLSDAIGGNFTTTTRTPFVPVSGAGFVTQTGDLDFARGFRFSASLEVAKLDKGWVGHLDRARYVCKADGNGVLRPELQPPDASLGDEFVSNVNASGPSARKIYSVVGADPIVSDASMRPNLPTGVVDGVGTYSGTLNTTPLTSQQFVDATSPVALRVTDATCDSSTVNLNATQCRDRYLKWLVGLDNGTVNHRCPSVATGNCSLVADIFHSIPRAVPGRPAQFLTDSSYEAFVKAQVTAKRPAMLYASSNDGFLHAFKIAQVDKSDTSERVLVKTKETNELWTFVPPGVLPSISGYYPGTHQLLLDGTPTIKEVVASKDASLGTYPYRLERTLAEARGGTGTWRTILVQSYGAQRPGYFAIDITDPDPSKTDGGPKFLWQLVTDASGAQLFGSGGGTPLITTVYLDGKEVAVAILPGGYGSPGTAVPAPGTGGCARAKTLYTDWPDADAPKPRSYVPCYSGTGVLARSVTVVRLDSGEILRTFRRDRLEVPGIASDVVKEVPLDSPMTGQPVAFPPDVGGVADRVFIGDQDGTLWRLNFASEKGDRKDWNLDLFFDGFPKGTLNGDNFAHDWSDGQPIITTPVLSVDGLGRLTIAFSTGDQEALGSAPGLTNYVWSLTEKASDDRTQLTPLVNWHLDFKDTLEGDRVVGEMALYQGDLYFSTVGPAKEVCSSGSGKVWGMHYVKPNSAGNGKGGIPSSTLSDPDPSKSLIGSGGYIDASTLLGKDSKAFLAGASVGQQPTCESPGTTTDAGYFGYGVRPASPPTEAGQVQLFIPTGDQTSTSTKANVHPVKGGVAIDLAKPKVSLLVDSWASVVE